MVERRSSTRIRNKAKRPHTHVESQLYDGVKRALTSYLRQGDDRFPIMLEITANKFPESLKPYVPKELLLLLTNRDMRPDLFGHLGPDCTETYGRTNFVITAEVKPYPITVSDVFQAKKYGEIFFAKFALLISPMLPKQETIELLKMRLDFLGYSSGNCLLYIGRYAESEKRIDWWFDKTEPRQKYG